MSLLRELRATSAELATPGLLRYLVTERFPGKMVVSASLRARSIVVLSMIAEADPATPAVFCRPGYLFPTSLEYRERIIEILGLTNISDSEGRETYIESGAQDYLRTHVVRVSTHLEEPSRLFT